MISSNIAILVMLVSAALMSLSSIVLKIAGKQMPPMEGQSVGENLWTLVRNRTWILGLFLSISALALNTVALASADMSLIQPLSGFGLIVLVVAARFLLGERISRREMLGIAVAIVGVVLVGRASGGASSTQEAIVLGVYLKPMALLWLGLLFGFVVFSWLLCRACGYRGAGLVFAANTSIASVLGLTFSRGFFSQLGADGQLSWVQFALLGVFLFFATAALFMQQFALQKGRAVVVVPIMNMLQVAAPIPTGLLVFNETVGPARYLGLVILLLGVLLLSLRSEEATPAEVPA